MQGDNATNNYKLEKSYISKLGLKVKSYVICYDSEESKVSVREEITKSCLRIFDKIKG